MDSPLLERQTYLIRSNVACLQQALDLLRKLPEHRYTQNWAALPGQKVSGHVRHVIEFYECFLEGLTECHVDYDARLRDHSLETSRSLAVERLARLIEHLSSDQRLQGDSVVWVRAEGAAKSELHDGYLVSSVGRELQSLASHAVHHFALIGFLLQVMGETVPSDFGVAPSTLAFRTTLRTAEAA